MSATKATRKTDIGPPHYEQFLPPIIKKNYGKWKNHEILKPGVLMHVAESGDKLYSVRAATARLASTKTIRLFADIADEFCGGYLRWTLARAHLDSHCVSCGQTRPQVAGRLFLSLSTFTASGISPSRIALIKPGISISTGQPSTQGCLGH